MQTHTFHYNKIVLNAANATLCRAGKISPDNNIIIHKEAILERSY